MTEFFDDLIKYVILPTISGIDSFNSVFALIVFTIFFGFLTAAVVKVIVTAQRRSAEPMEPLPPESLAKSDNLRRELAQHTSEFEAEQKSRMDREKVKLEHLAEEVLDIPPDKWKKV